MYLKPFLKYLLRHKTRLAVALVAMVFASWLQIVMIGLVIPAVDCMFPVAETSAVGKLSDRATTGTIQLERTAAESAQLEQEVAQPDKSLSDRLKQKLKNSKLGGKALQLRYDVEEWFKNKYVRGDAEAKMRGLLLVVAILISSGLLRGFFEFVSAWAMAHTFFKIALQIREDLFRHIINLDYLFFSKHAAGYLESRVQNDVGGIRDIFRDLARGAVQDPIEIVFLLGFLLLINWQLTGVIFVAVPICALVLLYFARVLRKVTRKQRRKMDALNSVMEEAFRNYKIIHTYHTADYETARFVRENDAIFKYYMKGRMARFAASPIIEALGTLGMGAVIIIGGRMILGGADDAIKPGQYIAYLFALSRLYGPVKRLTRLNDAWQSGRVSAERITEMMNRKPLVVDVAQPRPIERFEELIELERVSFAYGDKTVLSDLSFSVPKGKIIAIVGKTGAGKTTLVNLLSRLIDPTSGVVKIDGVDIRQYKLEDLRHLFGIVTQEIILFNETVARNIAYGEKKLDRERIEQAAKAANAHEFILKLEGGLGYDSNIGMDGARLSGGQRQRLAIARAIYRDPQILIFDEATSSLDEDTQRQVQEAIDHLLENRTAFVIAHRLSTIRHADEILVLSDGRLIERGSHDELLQKKAYYSKLYNLTDDLD